MVVTVIVIVGNCIDSIVSWMITFDFFKNYSAATLPGLSEPNQTRKGTGESNL